MSKRLAGRTMAIIVTLLLAGIRPSVAGGEEKTAAARLEAMANLLAKAQRLGVATDHVAFRGATADVQLWIARERDALPQRIVITYRLAEGKPQFEADFHGWTFNPDVPDSAFTFVPAASAEKIPILTPEREAGEKQP